MNFSKQKEIETAAPNKGRMIAPATVVAALATTGLVLWGQANKEFDQKYPYDQRAIEQIQANALEVIPGQCEYAFESPTRLNADSPMSEGLGAAKQELARQGNLMIVPAALTRIPLAEGSYELSEDQQRVIGASAQDIARKAGEIDDPMQRIAICEVPKGVVLKDQSAYVVVDLPVLRSI